MYQENILDAFHEIAGDIGVAEEEVWRVWFWSQRSLQLPSRAGRLIDFRILEVDQGV